MNFKSLLNNIQLIPDITFDYTEDTNLETNTLATN